MDARDDPKYDLSLAFFYLDKTKIEKAKLRLNRDFGLPDAAENRMMCATAVSAVQCSFKVDAHCAITRMAQPWHTGNFVSLRWVNATQDSG